MSDMARCNRYSAFDEFWLADFVGGWEWPSLHNPKIDESNPIPTNVTIGKPKRRMAASGFSPTPHRRIARRLRLPLVQVLLPGHTSGSQPPIKGATPTVPPASTKRTSATPARRSWPARGIPISGDR